jgi:putative Mn2+ efflux pump MntP
MTETLFTLITLGIVIGLNNLTVALSLGAMGKRDRQARILLVFAVFEFMLPLLGVWLGQQVSGRVANYAAWLGPALLILLGALTLISAIRVSKADREKLAKAVTSWWGLITLSASLSTDNLLAGFALGLDGIEPLALALTIMTFSVLFAWGGLNMGHRIQRNFEREGAALSGVLLILLALWMLAE